MRVNRAFRQIAPWCRKYMVSTAILLILILIYQGKIMSHECHLSRRGLVMPYGITDLGQPWLKRFVARQHQAIILTIIKL